MREYFVHILNWPVLAENPEEAAKEAHIELGCILTGMNPVLTVTNKEAEIDLDLHIDPDGYGHIKSWEFDSEIWHTKEDN